MNDPRTVQGSGGAGFTSNPGALTLGGPVHTGVVTAVASTKPIDGELAALAACVNALVQLDEESLQRVLHYLRERFEEE